MSKRARKWLKDQAEAIGAAPPPVNPLLDDPAERPNAARPPPPDSPASDLLKGVPSIARFIGETVRVTYYQLETGALPAFKRGRNWYLRKSAFYADVAAREAEARNQPLPAWRRRPQPPEEEVKAEAPPRRRVPRERLR
jgi:hypothetical protein